LKGSIWVLWQSASHPSPRRSEIRHHCESSNTVLSTWHFNLTSSTSRALGGFVITTTPLACCLMAWRGASGNGVAFMWDIKIYGEGALSNELNSGPIIFLGGLLLLITSVLEFIIGNTFPCVVFGTIGGSFYLMGQNPKLLVHDTDTLPRRVLVCVCGHNDSSFQCSRSAHSIPIKIPVCSRFIAPYSSTSDTAAGLASEDFMNTYGKCSQATEFDQWLWQYQRSYS
jgi:hypothetical protein